MKIQRHEFLRLTCSLGPMYCVKKHVEKVTLGSTCRDHIRRRWCVGADGLNGKGPPTTGDRHYPAWAKMAHMSPPISWRDCFPYPWTTGTTAFPTWDSKAYEQLPTPHGFILDIGVWRLGLSPASSQAPRVSDDRCYR